MDHPDLAIALPITEEAQPSPQQFGGGVLSSIYQLLRPLTAYLMALSAEHLTTSHLRGHLVTLRDALGLPAEQTHPGEQIQPGQPKQSGQPNQQCQALLPASPAQPTRRPPMCSHLTMTRLYNSHDGEKELRCGICKREGGFGWVYACTQDANYPPSLTLSGDSSASSTASTSSDKDKDDSERSGKGKASKDYAVASTIRDAKLSTESPASKPTPLAPWMEFAIRSGHYTHSQISLLRAQKAHVLSVSASTLHSLQKEEEEHRVGDAVRAETARIISEHDSTEGEDEDDEAMAKQAKETEASSQERADSEAVAMTHVDALPHVLASQPTIEATETGEEEQIRQHHHPLPPLPPRSPKRLLMPSCTFMACQSCRPTYRDRAWARFEDALTASGPPDIDTLEFDSECPPRFASAEIMQGIGLKTFTPECGEVVEIDEGESFGEMVQRPALRRWESRDVVSERKGDGSAMATRRAGARSSMRAAVRKWIERRESARGGGGSGYESDEEDRGVDVGVAEEVGGRALAERVGELDLGDGVGRRDFAESPDEFELGEGEAIDVINSDEKGEGDIAVAVTEEAAEMDAPDVIVSV